jgi:spermidine/putrescine-binding protein
MYRADILDKLGITVPTTYDEVLAAAQKIKDAKAVDYPLGATMKAGWNLGEEFVNMYLGFGGGFFGPDGKASVRNEAGVKALETMKKLTAFMSPEYLTADSTVVQQQFQQGKIAMANLWASRAGALDNDKESQVVGKVKSAAAPLGRAGGKIATTLWWDGAAIAKNVSDKEAEAAFQLVVAGLSKDMVAKNNDDAIWLVEGYQPGRLAEGAIKSLQSGATGYPVTTQMGLLHNALGNNLADYFTGKTSAEEALGKVEAAYATAAREAGLLQQ